MHEYSITIIGGGFSGLMSTVHLVESAASPLRIHIIDNGSFPLGAAYATDQQVHLLNVRAFNMSAFSTKPTDFVDWLHNQPAYAEIAEEQLRIQFIPRKTYGQYLQEIWEKTKKLAQAKNVDIHIIQDTVVDLDGEANNYVVRLESGKTVTTNLIILATGHAAPSIPAFVPAALSEHPHFVTNPWTYDNMINPENPDICILGSGLTMVDTVLGLLQSNSVGTIWFHSRKGLFPLSHEHYIKSDFLTIDDLPSLRLGDLIAVYKYWYKQLESEGKPGYLAIDKFRPITQDIWKQFTPHEKKYFLRFLRTPYNVARHRIAHEIFQQLQVAMQMGRLRFIGGKLKTIASHPNHLSLEFNQSPQKQTIHVGKIINCTGPGDSYRHSNNPVIKSIIEKGFGVEDEIDLGLLVDDQFRVLGQGNAASSIFATGVVIKGTLWESFAVPDLRKQIEQMIVSVLSVIESTTQSASYSNY